MKGGIRYYEFYKLWKMIMNRAEIQSVVSKYVLNCKLEAIEPSYYGHSSKHVSIYRSVALFLVIATDQNRSLAKTD